MFTTSPQRSNTDALAGDFAVIARIEASLTPPARRERSSGSAQPDFSRLKRFIPDLKH